MKACVLFLLLSITANAATKFYAQSAAGANDGSSAGNAYSAAQFNAASPYSPVADDILTLTGNITTPLVVPTSGTSGHPITILFASGATMSKGNWNQGGTNQDAAIYVNGKSFITVDLGTNGIIEATTNGTGLTTSLDDIGIYFKDAPGGIVRNGTIRNMYQRTNGAENNYLGGGVNFFDSTTTSGFLVDGVTMSQAGTLINLSFTAASTFEVKNCNLSVSGVCINIGSTGTGATMSGVLVHDNIMSTSLAWSGQPAIHKEMVHASSVANSSSLTGCKIYNNTTSGFMGSNSTAHIFLEGYVYSPLVYNNLFLPSTNDFSGQGFVYVKGTQNAVVANNTFVGVSADGNAVCTGPFGALGTGLIIKNNVVTNMAFGIVDNDAPVFWNTTGTSYDYNVYFPSTMSFQAGTGTDTFAQWKAEIITQISAGIGGDVHSVTTTPNLDGSYYPVAPSSAIGTGSNFADMSAYYTVDKAGVAWAGGTGWGGGALKAAGTVTNSSSLTGKITLSGKVSVK